MPTAGGGGATSVASANIVDGTIANIDVNSAAAIAYSKLNLAGSIVSADLDPSLVQVVTVNVSSANILAMFATPVTVIAGVAGKIIEVVGFCGQFTNGGTQYTGGGNVELHEETSGTAVTGLLFTAAEVNGAAVVIKSTTPSLANKVRTSGKGLQVTNITGAFLTGTGTMKLYIAYRMITL